MSPWLDTTMGIVHACDVCMARFQIGLPIRQMGKLSPTCSVYTHRRSGLKTQLDRENGNFSRLDGQNRLLLGEWGRRANNEPKS